jgi:hypothetical protein
MTSRPVRRECVSNGRANVTGSRGLRTGCRPSEGPLVTAFEAGDGRRATTGALIGRHEGWPRARRAACDPDSDLDLIDELLRHARVTGLDLGRPSFPVPAFLVRLVLLEGRLPHRRVDVDRALDVVGGICVGKAGSRACQSDSAPSDILDEWTYRQPERPKAAWLPSLTVSPSCSSAAGGRGTGPQMRPGP